MRSDEVTPILIKCPRCERLTERDECTDCKSGKCEYCGWKLPKVTV